MHDDGAVRALQVEAEGLAALDGGRLVVHPGQELVHQVPADPQLGFGRAGQAGQLHGQDGGGVLQRHPVELPRPLLGVEEGDHAHHVRAG